MAAKSKNNQQSGPQSSEILDWLNANGGYTLVQGTAQADQLIGSVTADVFVGGAGDDSFDGVDGLYDTVDYSGAKKVQVNLAAGTAAGEGNDTLTNIANVIGSKGSDAITGDELDNFLEGGNGNDHLNGDAGYDTLYGDYGNDHLYGGADGDVLDGGAGNDRLVGGEGDDELAGGAGNDQLRGDAGNDSLYGGAGNDVMFGGSGDDTYYVEDAKDKVKENAGEGTDTIVSSSSYSLEKVKNVENLTLSGSADVDATGSSADNVLVGNSGDNVLNGLAGNDILVGAEGDDTLIGGTGDDLFVFDNLVGIDTVQDFTAGSDLLGLDALVFTSLAAGVQDANLVMGTAAVDADDFLIFDATTGALSYDADANGVGAAVQIATVGVSSLVASDFVVV